ncbi:MAG: DUF4424 family protein [Fimbriimonadaceae bacterium]|nr:DUF4424 family protein [Fimbriimonadaceae bacterium]
MTLTLVAALALNDSAVMGVGGVVTQFDETTKVRMLGERILIDVAKAQVDAYFTFQNTGPRTVVTMGFPEEGGGDISVPTDEKPTWFKSFESWVDGERFETVRRVGKGDDIYYRQWWVKEVPFGGGQVRRVRNLYTTQHGGNAMGQTFLVYVLATGAPWKGTIARGEVRADITGLPPGIIGARPPGWVREGNELVWRFTDKEPTEEDNVTVTWVPSSTRHPYALEAMRTEFPDYIRR